MTDWLELENRIRATPLDLLKQGIERKQWEAVEACYFMLTGKTVSKTKELIPAKTKGKRGRPKKTILPEPEDNIDEIEDEEEILQPIRNYGNSSKIKSRSVKVNISGKKNTWKDNGTLAIEDKRWAPTDKALAKRRTTEKKYKKYKKVSVVCRICNKQDMVDPMCAPVRLTSDPEDDKMTYVCNKCKPGG